MTSSNDSDSFAEQWTFPSEVRKSIPGAGYYDVRPAPGTFKSGRPKFACFFLSADKTRIVATRPAMELTSKKSGQPYFLCRTGEASAWKRSEAAKALDEILSKPRGRSLDEVLADIERP